MMLAFILLSLLTFLRGKTTSPFDTVHCECQDGFYLKERKCNKCPDRCSACEKNDFCTVCRNGYYGPSCSSRCNPNCRNDSCSKFSGFCLSCEDGYFFDTNLNCVSCPTGCSICSGDNECSACEIGFKGSICKERCVNCKTGTGCDRNTGECLTCEDGLSGLKCEQKCSPKCRSCHRLDKDTCTFCAPNRHGANCEFFCRKKCADSVCFEESCWLGCSEGYWGTNCENKCSTNCLRKVCERYSGLCIYNCTGNFTDGICNCPSQCSCDDEDRCVYCNESSELNCGPPCSEGCKGQYCYRETRKCLEGCRDSYRGLRCDEYKPEFNGGNNKEMWLISLLAVPVAVIALVTICRLRSRRQTQNQQSSTMQQASEYIEIPDLQQRAYTELNEELREHPSSSAYTPLGFIDGNEKITDKTADRHDSAYLTPVSSPKQESLLESRSIIC